MNGKNKSINYFRGNSIIKIIVRGEFGNKEFSATCSILDKKRQAQIGKTLMDKYGIDFTPTVDPSFQDKKGFFDY